MEVITRKIYKSVDGIEFDDKESCLKHEESLSELRYFTVFYAPDVRHVFKTKMMLVAVSAPVSAPDGYVTLVRHYCACVCGLGEVEFVNGLPTNSFDVYPSNKSVYFDTEVGKKVGETLVTNRVFISDTNGIRRMEEMNMRYPASVSDYTKWKDAAGRYLFQEKDDNDGDNDGDK